MERCLEFGRCFEFLLDYGDCLVFGCVVRMRIGFFLNCFVFGCGVNFGIF